MAADESPVLPDRSSAQQIYCVECHDDGTLQPVVRKLGAWWCPRHRDEGTVRFAEALGLVDPLKRGVPTIIFASHGYADVEAYDRLRAENEALRAALRSVADHPSLGSSIALGALADVYSDDAQRASDEKRRCGRCFYDETSPTTAEHAMCEAEGGHQWGHGMSDSRRTNEGR